MAITDLTNTTWVVPAGWSAAAGYGRFYDINYDFDWEYEERIGYLSALFIGYSGPPNFESDQYDSFTTPKSDLITTWSGGDTVKSSNSFTITFTGGTDVTNPSLISWLEANGECQNPPAPEEPAVTIQYNGTVIASLKAGQTATLPCKDTLMHTDVVVSVPEGMGGADVPEWDGSYTVSGGLPSFTIDGETYYFEDGMTWKQWCDSEYNIDNTYYYDNYYVNSTLKVGYITTTTNNYQPIPPTDAIIDGQAYKILSTGGGVD